VSLASAKRPLNHFVFLNITIVKSVKCLSVADISSYIVINLCGLCPRSEV
jgi:hypothetical protein